MQNPFCDAAQLKSALEELKTGWQQNAVQQIMLALEGENFVVQTKPDKPRLLKFGVIADAIDWLSQNWSKAPSLAQRLQGFLITYSLCESMTDATRNTQNRNRFSDFAKVLQEEWLRALAGKKHNVKSAVENFGETDAWLGWYINEMFGLSFEDVKLLLSLIHTKPQPPGPTLYSLLENKLSLTEIRFLTFGDAAKDITEVKVVIDSDIKRPAAVVEPSGQTHLFLTTDTTNCPLEAARIAHEWAHIHHLRQASHDSNNSSLNFTTFDKEYYATQKEFEFLERIPSKDKHTILNAWVKQNLIDTLLEFKQNLVWLTNPDSPCSEVTSLVPLEACVYAVATQKILKTI